MPSEAYDTFHENLGDIETLSEIHAAITGNQPGRRFYVSMLNKASIVMVCGAWEAFCEEIINEAIDLLVANCTDFNQLPELLRKSVAKAVKDDLDQLSPWQLAGTGWQAKVRSLAKAAIAAKTGTFNTPKPANLIDLFKITLGIPDITVNWRKTGTPGRNISVVASVNKLKNYVVMRGEIAHKVRTIAPVRKVDVTDFRKHVRFLADKVEQTGI